MEESSESGIFYLTFNQVVFADYLFKYLQISKSVILCWKILAWMLRTLSRK